MGPKISVIIPTYNRADLIKESIESVLNQTYQDFEVIVVDDGSTDNTKEVVALFSPRVKYLYQINTGLPSKARNSGILEANGEYIAFLDSDDKWAKTKLAKQMYIFEKFTWVDLVFTGVVIIDKKGNVLKKKKGKIVKEDVLVNLLKNGNFITNSSVLVKKKVLFDVGLLDEDPKIRGSEDFFLWAKLALNYKFYSVPDELTMYRKNEMSICIPLGMETVYKKIFLNKEMYSHIFRYRKKCLAKLHYELARYYFSHRNFYNAKEEFFKTIINNCGFLACYFFLIASLLMYKISTLLKKKYLFNNKI